MRKPLFIVFAVVLVGYLGFKFFFMGNAPSEGDLAPDFKTELVDGSPFELSQLRGNYVLLDFWGSWCRPCRVQNPSLVALYNKFKGKKTSDGGTFEVVTVALEKSEDAWKRAAAADGFSWPYQIVENSKIVMMSGLAQKYGVTDIPAKFLILPDGSLKGDLHFNEIEAILAQELH